MSKFFRWISALALLLVASSPPMGTKADLQPAAPRFSSAYELIDAVNALRASYGLAGYQINSILMNNAQAQADYNAAIGSITHVSADGLRPHQRALAAGYMVAGDISNGSPGFFSENIVAGSGMTAEEAVQWWTGDDPHMNTMISGMLQDIGAGVGQSGDVYYYVIDCGRSGGSSSSADYSPAPQNSSPNSKSTPTNIPNTPNPDGSIVHIVLPGDTTLAIALQYGISLTDLLKTNNLLINSIIYPGQELIIRPAFTPTPTQPTSTPTRLPTITPWPTSELTETPTVLPTATPSPGAPISAAGGAVAAITVTALVLAGLVTLLGRRRKG